jgi:hypothetical protein
MSWFASFNARVDQWLREVFGFTPEWEEFDW